MEFYNKVNKLCKERGITITALSTELGYANSTPTGWKNGAAPHPKRIKEVADFFGVSIEYLSNDDDEPSVSASNIHNSNVVQGNRATTLIVRNGGVMERTLSEQEVELLRVFNLLTIRDQTRLLSFAFELEGDGEYSMAARGTEGVVQFRNKKEKVAVDRAFDTADDQ